MSKKFKVGSKVRITDSIGELHDIGVISYASEVQGQEGTVARVDTDDTYLPYQVAVPGVPLNYWFQPNMLKAVKVAKPSVAKPKTAKPKTTKPKPVKIPGLTPKPKKLGLSFALRLYPQTRKVLAHLEAYGTISPLEAFGVYRITRLAARIKEIRAAGVAVKTSMKTDATGTRYAEYVLTHA
jgi:hypothetical protein